MSKNFQPLSSGEVLSVSSESQFIIGHSTFRVSEFTAALKQLMLDNGIGGLTPEKIDWLTADGIECDVLRFGSTGWVKGKVRLHLEFAEEEGGEASPDPKFKAATEPLTSVAAVTTPVVPATTAEEVNKKLEIDAISEPDLSAITTATETLDVDLDLDFAATSEPDLSESPTATSEDFDFGFDTEEESAEPSDEVADDLFEESFPTTTEPEADSGADFDFDFDEEPEAEEEPASLDLELETDLGFGESDLDFDTTETPAEIAQATVISQDTFVQEDEESLDDLFGEPSFAESRTPSTEDLDELFGEEETTTSAETEDAFFASDVIADPFAEDVAEPAVVPPIAMGDESLGDLFTEAAATDDFFAAMPAEPEAETEAALDEFDLGLDEAEDFTLDELAEEEAIAHEPEQMMEDDLEAADLGLEEFGLDELEEDLASGSLDDDFSLHDFSSDTPAPLDDLAADFDLGTDDDLDAMLGEEPRAVESEMSFDDLLAEDETVLEDFASPDIASPLDDFDEMGSEMVEDSFAAFAEEEAAAMAVSADEDSLAALAGDDDFGLAIEDELPVSNHDAEDFSFDEPAAGMVSTDMDLDDLFETEEAALPDHLNIESEADLPPEIDFGSTQDLGEFIDVSILKRKKTMTPPPAKVEAVSIPEEVDDDLLGDASLDDLGDLGDSPFGLDDDVFTDTDSGAGLMDDEMLNSPFDLGDDEFADMDAAAMSMEEAATDSPFHLDDDDLGMGMSFAQGEDDIALGDLLNDEDDDFDFDALGADPLDAITGDEDEVSAKLWDLE